MKEENKNHFTHILVISPPIKHKFYFKKNDFFFIAPFYLHSYAEEGK